MAHCRKCKPSVTMANGRGEVTERLKVLASKASVRETVPWVRIPPSPPFLKSFLRQFSRQKQFSSFEFRSLFCACTKVRDEFNEFCWRGRSLRIDESTVSLVLEIIRL